MIEDWIDFILLFGMSFFLIVLGVWTLPQLPEHTRFWFALSIMASSIYLTKKQVFYLVYKLKEKKK